MSMTNEDLRKLDATIARRIMGWTEVHIEDGSWFGTAPGKKTKEYISYYSQVRNCAWEVAEKVDLFSKGTIYKQQSGIWTFEQWGGPLGLFVTKETLMLVLCYSALLLKGLTYED